MQTLITEHPFVAPLLERFGISTHEQTERRLDEAARSASVASHALCDALEASIGGAHR